MRLCKAITIIIGLLYLMPAVSDEQHMLSVWSVDYSGKPPFKRKLERVRQVDLASFETGETTVINTTDFSGKPPYKRNKETVRVVDMAQFETVDDEKFVPTPRRMKHSSRK